MEYDGVSNHHKLLDTNANFEEFDVKSTDGKLRIRAQTLRMYNPETHQWSIYGLELDKGSLETPPLVGSLAGDHSTTSSSGRDASSRYIWKGLSAKAAHMDQAFSADGGKTWELNWICDLSR